MSDTPARTASRPYHHGDLRNALLDAVEALLHERGRPGLSLRECARRAGVSHGAPAHHFGDLTGMMTAFAVRAFTRFDTALARGLATGGSGVDRLHAVGVAYIAFARDNPGAFSVMFEKDMVDRDDPALNEASENAFNRLLDALRLVNLDAGRTAEDDLAGRATAAWSMVHGYARLIIEGPFRRMGNAGKDEDVLRYLVDGVR